VLVLLSLPAAVLVCMLLGLMVVVDPVRRLAVAPLRPATLQLLPSSLLCPSLLPSALLLLLLLLLLLELALAPAPLDVDVEAPACAASAASLNRSGRLPAARRRAAGHVEAHSQSGGSAFGARRHYVAL
jgi:hypothetical protein